MSAALFYDTETSGLPLFILAALTAALAVLARVTEWAYQSCRSAFLRLADWIEP